jgi:hypothetical protein
MDQQFAHVGVCTSVKGPPEAVETSCHTVEADHSTGGEWGTASPFGFDAAGLLLGSTTVALHVPGPSFDHWVLGGGGGP